jgi:hypothetical protein
LPEKISTLKFFCANLRKVILIVIRVAGYKNLTAEDAADVGFFKKLFENSKKSPKATNIIAYGETIGCHRIIQPLAESEQHFAPNCSTLSASDGIYYI